MVVGGGGGGSRSPFRPRWRRVRFGEGGGGDVVLSSWGRNGMSIVWLGVGIVVMVTGLYMVDRLYGREGFGQKISRERQPSSTSSSGRTYIPRTEEVVIYTQTGPWTRELLSKTHVPDTHE